MAVENLNGRLKDSSYPCSAYRFPQGSKSCREFSLKRYLDDFQLLKGNAIQRLRQLRAYGDR